MSDVTPDEMAEVLRWADFAMSQAGSAIIAFVPSAQIDYCERDLDRMADVRKVIRQMLERLPPEPPLTDEQEREAASLIRSALESHERRHRDGSEAAKPEESKPARRLRVVRNPKEK